jgi:hypothetical protein
MQHAPSLKGAPHMQHPPQLKLLLRALLLLLSSHLLMAEVVSLVG